MKCFLIIVLTLFLVSCSGDGSNSYYRPSKKSILVDEISSDVFKKLKKENDLYPIECGGRMMHQITLLHWGFCYHKEIDVNEARKLLLTASDQFLKAFNEDPRIRSYLATYPLTSKNIQVNIFLKNPDGSELGLDKLRVISMNEGVLDYMIRSSETGRLTTIDKETYEEAAEKLASSVTR